MIQIRVLLLAHHRLSSLYLIVTIFLILKESVSYGANSAQSNKQTTYSSISISSDTLGHLEGDHALLDIAAILKETFRESDIIGRMGGVGGDEFAILALDTGEVNPETLTSRLQNCVDGFNQKVTRPFHLSISMGMAHYNPDHPLGIDQLIAEADRLMYEQKRNKNTLPER